MDVQEQSSKEYMKASQIGITFEKKRKRVKDERTRREYQEVYFDDTCSSCEEKRGTSSSSLAGDSSLNHFLSLALILSLVLPVCNILLCQRQ